MINPGEGIDTHAPWKWIALKIFAFYPPHRTKRIAHPVPDEVRLAGSGGGASAGDCDEAPPGRHLENPLPPFTSILIWILLAIIGWALVAAVIRWV